MALMPSMKHRIKSLPDFWNSSGRVGVAMGYRDREHSMLSCLQSPLISGQIPSQLLGHHEPTRLQTPHQMEPSGVEWRP